MGPSQSCAKIKLITLTSYIREEKKSSTNQHIILISAYSNTKARKAILFFKNCRLIFLLNMNTKIFIKVLADECTRTHTNTHIHTHIIIYHDQESLYQELQD